jgi:hypothetical protein
MRDLDWFDGPEQDADGDRRRAPRRWLLPLLAVPWLVVVALLVLPRVRRTPARRRHRRVRRPPSCLPGPAATTDGNETIHAGPRSEPSPDPSIVHGGDPPPTVHQPPDGRRAAGAPREPATVLQLEELRGRWRVGPGSEEAAALAIAIARGWLTGLGPRLALPGATPEPDTYAEHLVVEAVEQPSERTSVVTVLAVVLTEPEDQEMTVDVRRLAVPLATDQGAPRPAGAPWLLPGPTLTPAEVELAPVDDPAAVDAATTALAVAGLGDLEVRALASAEGWPVVATASDGEHDHTIWLRPHLDGFVVAGSTLAGRRQRTGRAMNASLPAHHHRH